MDKGLEAAHEVLGYFKAAHEPDGSPPAYAL